MSALVKYVNFLLIAKSVQLINCGSAAVWCFFFGSCRLLVVLTEEHDLCLSKTGRLFLRLVKPGDKVSLLLTGGTRVKCKLEREYKSLEISN